MSFLNGNKTPVGYGVIMYNGSTGGMSSWYPFFTSQADIGALTALSTSGASGTISLDNIDDYWTVMPGYKLIVYTNPNYTTLSLTGDNTNGTSQTSYTMSPNYNLASSIQLYFKGNLINDPNPIGLIATNYATTYTLAYNSVNYRVYEFYTGSTGTFSVPTGSSSLNILCLLIGGGGGGGMYITQGATAAGAGGAGTFLTTTISATPGYTFNVTVGAGGNGAAANTTNAGTAGTASSIARSLSGATDTLLIAGGGGSGGALSSTTGSVGSPYGSTGGTGGMAAAGVTYPIVANNAAGTAYTVTAVNTVFNNISAFVNNGGNSSYTGGGGGGGGAGGPGGDVAGSYSGGAGGAGKAWAVTGSRLFAGGGGGVNSTLNGGINPGAAGSGGGGSFANPVVAVTENTGSGGAGAFSSITAGKGASGICIIAIPF